MSGPRSSWGWAVTIAAAATIGWLTLAPGHPGPPSANGSDLIVTDLVLNVMLFIPLGIGLALLGRSRMSVGLIGAVASICIELAQLWWIAGRFAAVHDVITNGLGCVLGGVLVHAWASRAAWWRVLGPPVALAASVLWLAGGWLTNPAAPRAEPWWGQWVHDFAGTVRYPGRIVAFAVNGVPVPDNTTPDAALLRSRIAGAGAVHTQTTFITGGSFPGRAQLVGLVAANGDELVSLWAEGSTILARQRLRQSELSVRTPWLALERALPGSVGDTVIVTLDATPRELRLSAVAPGSRRENRLGLSSEVFWTGFLPFEWEAGRSSGAWPLLAVAVLFLVVGLGAAGRAPSAVVLVGAAVLLTGARLTPGGLPEASACVVALVAAGAGLALGRWLIGGRAR